MRKHIEIKGPKSDPRAAASQRKREMTPETAQLIVDILNVEHALQFHAGRDGMLLAAGLAAYRRHLEQEGGFIRVQPDHAPDWLKYIEIQRGNGWLKLTDIRVKNQK